jgi:hypothetical protein
LTKFCKWFIFCLFENFYFLQYLHFFERNDVRVKREPADGELVQVGERSEDASVLESHFAEQRLARHEQDVIVTSVTAADGHLFTGNKFFIFKSFIPIRYVSFFLVYFSKRQKKKNLSVYVEIVLPFFN